MCDRQFQCCRYTRMDGQEILEGPWECTPGVPTMIEFIDLVLEGDRCARPRVLLCLHLQRQDAGVQLLRHNL